MLRYEATTYDDLSARSAREAEELVRQALAKGEVLPTEERFDSNCITPGMQAIWQTS